MRALAVAPAGVSANKKFLGGRKRKRNSEKIHLVAADARTAVSFSLSPGHAHDAPHGSELLKNTGLSAKYVIMDRAYEGEHVHDPSRLA